MGNLSGAFDEERFEFEKKFQYDLYEQGKLDDEYAGYIMENCHGDRIICNGDTLVEAMESQYLLDDFIESRI